MVLLVVGARIMFRKSHFYSEHRTRADATTRFHHLESSKFHYLGPRMALLQHRNPWVPLYGFIQNRTPLSRVGVFTPAREY